MLGLFKPPRYHIRKRTPQHALLSWSAIETFTEMNLEGLPEDQKGFAVSVIMSVWACNCAMTATFQLAQKDYEYIRNASMSSAKFLTPPSLECVEKILDDLLNKRFIPQGPETR